MPNRILVATQPRICIAIALLSSLVTLAPKAEACSPPFPSINVNALSANPTVSPVEGLWVVEITGQDPHDGQFEPEATVEVSNAAGEPIEGDLTWHTIQSDTHGGWGNPARMLLVWRATDPLEPGAQYDAKVFARELSILESGSGQGESQLETTFTVHEGETAVFTPQSLVAPGAMGVTLDGHWTATARTCCLSAEEGSCFGMCNPDLIDGQCAHCWGSDFDVRPVVSAQLDLDPLLEGRLLYTLTATSNTGEEFSRTRLQTADQLSESFYLRDNAAVYCVTLEVLDMLTGDTALSEPNCIEHAQMPELEPQDEPDHSAMLERCAEPPQEDDDEDNNENDHEDDHEQGMDDEDDPNNPGDDDPHHDDHGPNEGHGQDSEEGMESVEVPNAEEEVSDGCSVGGSLPTRAPVGGAGAWFMAALIGVFVGQRARR